MRAMSNVNSITRTAAAIAAQAAHLRTRGYTIVDKPYRIDDLLTAVQTLLNTDHARAVGA